MKSQSELIGTGPATNLLRRLKVYAGLSRAQGRLDAWLSDFSALPYSDSSLLQGYGDACAVYTLAFASANPGASLNVTRTPSIAFDANFGNVTWQAATISLLHPVPFLQVVSPPSPNQFAFSFHAEVDANYTVLSSDSSLPSNWQVLTNFPGTGADAVIVDPAIGGSQRSIGCRSNKTSRYRAARRTSCPHTDSLAFLSGGNGGNGPIARGPEAERPVDGGARRAYRTVDHTPPSSISRICSFSMD